jgi:hypothetical protein
MSLKIREGMGSIPARNVFFQSGQKFLVWFWLQIFFYRKPLAYGLSESKIFKISDYRNIEHRASKLERLSDIGYQTQTIRYRI